MKKPKTGPTARPTDKHLLMADQPQQQQQIQLRIPEEVLKGRYANLVRIDTTREEFIFDFGTVNPQQGNGAIIERIYMNPSHVKRMIDVLQRVMGHYEKNHGSVAASESHNEIGFQTS